jgi:hypothetical protein
MSIDYTANLRARRHNDDIFNASVKKSSRSQKRGAKKKIDVIMVAANSFLGFG